MKWHCVNGVWHDRGGNLVETFPIQISSYADCVKRSSDIPLEIAQEAYKEYAAQFGTQHSLERLGERGGFGVGEIAWLLYDRIKRIENNGSNTR